MRLQGALGAKNQQAKNLTAQEAVVLTTAIKNARMMARALHVHLVTATTDQHQIANAFLTAQVAAMNLLATANRAKAQTK
jgi:hypothetical protein